MVTFTVMQFLSYLFVYLLVLLPGLCFSQSAPTAITIHWVDSLSGDFNFIHKWDYPDNVIRNNYGELVCDGICDESLYVMRDDSGRILPHLKEKYYSIFDTTHQYHTISCNARCYEWAGTDYVYVRRVGDDSILCNTICNSATHSSLKLVITKSTCMARIELVSIKCSNGPVYFTCKSGNITIDQPLYNKGVLKAVFDFDFGYNNGLKETMYWRGYIQAFIGGE